MLKRFALIAFGFAALSYASAQAESRDDLQRVCVTVSVADGLSEEESQDFCECLTTGAEEQGQESIDELVESAEIPDRQAGIDGLSETSQNIVAVCAP
mgnify:FL=1